MSAILSADDLNDFISPGVACIKPVETLPKKQPKSETIHNDTGIYEVKLGEEKRLEEEAAVATATTASAAEAAQISLTDCLACSGCVTSAEAVLVSLQSHMEVLKVLDDFPALDAFNVASAVDYADSTRSKLFVATVSPQTRASLATAFGVSERRAGYMIEQFLSGPKGLKAGGKHGSAFALVLDSNVFREIALKAAVDEVQESLTSPKNGQLNGDDAAGPQRPVLASACPGWICYVEKTHPHILPYLSRLKSPQAIAGTFVKTVLSRRFGISPSDIWHMALMPCFDKKLEASRSELSSATWANGVSDSESVRDVDCVITARELLQLAAARDISFGDDLPTRPLRKRKRGEDRDEVFKAANGSLFAVLSDPVLDEFILSRPHRRFSFATQSRAAGPSGGYLWHILQHVQASHPGSSIKTQRGRNADVLEYTVVRGNEAILRAARCYGFRNIQNLVRRLRPAKTAPRMLGKATSGPTGKPRRSGTAGSGGSMEDYAFVEVMACPGGCTNGGGQIRIEDMPGLGRSIGDNGSASEISANMLPAGQRTQKEWLVKVDEAYFSAETSNGSDYEDQLSGDESYENNEHDSHDKTNGFVRIDEKQASLNDQHFTNGSAPSPSNDLYDINVNRLHSNQALHHHHHQTNEQNSKDESDYIEAIIRRWATFTAIEPKVLLYTTYRQVESDVGKDREQTDVQRVAGLASAVGGGW